MRPSFSVYVLLLGMMVLGASVVSGQSYPSKPIRIVTASPGGGSDSISRLIAQDVSGPLGQPVIVENRTGILAAEAVAKAPPDGYTVLLLGSSLWIGPLLSSAPYDPVKDFSPISLLMREVNILVVHPSVPAKSVKELIGLTRAKPGELTWASSATGSSGHLAGELFKSMAGINIVRIPYKGNAPSLTALIAGEVQMLITDLGFVAPHMKSGKVRALAVTSATPSVLTPGLPTVASELPGFEVVGITGIWAPAKTPGLIVNRLNQEILRVINKAEVKERFFNAAVEVVGSSPEQLDSFIKSDMSNMGKVIRDAGIKVN